MLHARKPAARPTGLIRETIAARTSAVTFPLLDLLAQDGADLRRAPSRPGSRDASASFTS